MKVVYCLVCFTLIGTNILCTSSEQEVVIAETASKVLIALKKGDVDEFMRLYAREDIKGTINGENNISQDVRHFSKLLNKRYGDKMPIVEVGDKYNVLGQRRVLVDVSFVNDQGVNQVLHLSLMFGPNKVYSYRKISGYSLVFNYDDTSDYKPIEYWKQR